MPLVGGELARAAFTNGFEDYGVDILRRYWSLISEKNETYLWYFPDGKPASVETSTSPEAQPTDGWGSSAMLYALIEGLAGVEDQAKLFQQVKLSPRWHAAGVSEAEVRINYAASGKFISYRYEQLADRINLTLEGDAHDVHCHILMPGNRSVEKCEVDGKFVNFTLERVENSIYVDFKCQVKGKSNIVISLG